MKLRVKLQGTSRIVDVGDGEQCTLSQLRQRAAELFQLQPQSFNLSLNKNDCLRGDEQTLSQLGLVPGDLLFILCPGLAASNQNNSANGTNSASASSSSSSAATSNCSEANDVGKLSETGEDTSSNDTDTGGSAHRVAVDGSHSQGGIQPTVDGSHSQGAIQASGTAEDQTMASCTSSAMSAVTDEATRHERDCISPSPLEDPEVNRCLQEPLLCRESTPSAVPAMLRDLYAVANPRSPADVLWVAVQALMMEVGFRPSQESEAMLAEGWNRRGFYKQVYCHLCVTAPHSCTIMGVPMGSTLVVHGVTNGDPPVKTDNQLIKVVDYVVEENIGQDVCRVFKSLERLSRQVKDLVCQPLLSQLSEVCGFPVSLGLLSLSYELKLKVLSYLPASSLMCMGQVCHDFRVTYKDPWLWRRLHMYDFGCREDSSLNKDWYKLYKEEYLLKKERKRNARHRHQALTGIPPWLNPPPGHFQPLPPLPYTSGIIGGDYDLNPEFASGLPPHPMFGRPQAPNPFAPAPPNIFQGPAPPPRPRFEDIYAPSVNPFGGGSGLDPHFMNLSRGRGSSSQRSRTSPFSSFAATKRFL